MTGVNRSVKIALDGGGRVLCDQADIATDASDLERRIRRLEVNPLR
jgi:hypothetical protein